MSNVFSIKEVENRVSYSNGFISMNAPGIKRFLKKGRKVKFRSDLKEGKNYGSLCFIGKGTMSSVKGKVCIIDSVCFATNNFKILETVYNYSLEMLEGVCLSKR